MRTNLKASLLAATAVLVATLAPLASAANANGIVLGKDANDNKVIVDSLYADGTQWRADGVFPGGGSAVRLPRPREARTGPFTSGGALFERTERGTFTGNPGIRGNPGYESGSSKR